MNYPMLDRQLEETRLRLSAIRSQAGAIAEPQFLLSQALEEVNQSLEELRVAEEELSLQNEELLSYRQKLEVERRRYHELFEFFPEAYVVTDAMGNIQEANQAAGRLLGVGAGFLIKKPLIIFVPEEAHDDFHGLLAEIRAGQTIRQELPVQPRGRSTLQAEFHVTGARTGQGFFLLRWMIRDVSQRGQAEQSLGDGEAASAKEKMSAIGRMLAGLADTSREALERTQAGLEKLALEIQDRPQALQWLADFQKAHEDLRQLHSCIKDYAAPVLLQQRETPDLVANPNP